MMKFICFIVFMILDQNSRITSNAIRVYSKCLETRVYCQGLPKSCIEENTSCSTLLIASPVNDNNNVKTGSVWFELFGQIETNRHWFAMGLSSDRQMGNDSVTEIYVSNDGKGVEFRQSWNEDKVKDNRVIGKVDGISEIGNVENSDGILSAKWIRDAVTEVSENQFNILQNKFNILLANGPISANNKKMHHLERSVSNSVVDLQFLNQNVLTEIYIKCKKSTANLCYGLPDNCIKSENCELVLQITNSGYGLSNGTIAFQLIGKTGDNDDPSGWVAMALSNDNRMGNDSVVECLVLINGTTRLRNSWNGDNGNEVIGAVDGVVATGAVVYDNGLINCKWTRTAYTVVANNIFDFNDNKYFILLAKGKIADQKTALKKMHEMTFVSTSAIGFEPNTTSTTSKPFSSTAMPSALSQAYKRCTDNQKLCFGFGSDDCIQSNDCLLLFSSISVSTGISDGSVEMELFWSRDSNSNTGWAAVGLSTDALMGKDSVTECIIRSNGSVAISEGWNPSGHSGTKNIVNNTSITRMDVSHIDGLVYCKWIRKGFFVVDQNDFDIQNNSYYLLLAYGPMNSAEDNIGRHTDKHASATKINLQSVGIIKSGSAPLLVKLHGAFMLIAWLVCVSVAILLASHYKNSWPDSTLCGVKLWFAFHRLLMILGIVLILSATISIVIHRKGWSGASVHSVIGLISIILSFLQPINALFRPNADSPKRWIFNLIHRSGGYVAHFLSFVTICFATKFPSLLPRSFLWIVISYIIVYILSHLLLHLRSYLRRNKTELNIRSTKLSEKFLQKMDTLQVLLNAIILIAFVIALLILLFN